MLFFWPEGQKFEKIGILGEIFQIQTQTKDADPTQPDPGQNILTWNHH